MELLNCSNNSSSRSENFLFFSLSLPWDIMIFFLPLFIFTCRLEGRNVVYSIVWLHSYSCPDLLVVCARMGSTCSLLNSRLSPLSHLASASAIPISCILCVRVCATNRHNKCHKQRIPQQLALELCTSCKSRRHTSIFTVTYTVMRNNPEKITQATLPNTLRKKAFKLPRSLLVTL